MTRNLQTRLSSDRARQDLRPPRPVILLRGLAATAGSLRRLQADPRAGSARDEAKPAVNCAPQGNKRCRFAATLTGGTGLEPATSGVTGRSWYSRAGRGQAGIPAVSRPSMLCLAGICGRRRELAAASSTANRRDQCGNADRCLPHGPAIPGALGQGRFRKRVRSRHPAVDCRLEHTNGRLLGACASAVRRESRGWPPTP